MKRSLTSEGKTQAKYSRLYEQICRDIPLSASAPRKRKPVSSNIIDPRSPHLTATVVGSTRRPTEKVVRNVLQLYDAVRPDTQTPDILDKTVIRIGQLTDTAILTSAVEASNVDAWTTVCVVTDEGNRATLYLELPVSETSPTRKRVGRVEGGLASTLSPLHAGGLIRVMCKMFLGVSYASEAELLLLVSTPVFNVPAVSTFLKQGNMLLTDPFDVWKREFERPCFYLNPHTSAPDGPCHFLTSVQQSVIPTSVVTRSKTNVRETKLVKVLNAKEQAKTPASFLQCLENDSKCEPGAVVPCPNISTVLHPHQHTALTFMMECERDLDNPDVSLWVRTVDRPQGDVWHHRITGEVRNKTPTEAKGSLLADDMGLGKTVSCLALISSTLEAAHAYSVRGVNPGDPRIRSRATVIICPPSVLLNWEVQLVQHWKGTVHMFTAKDVALQCRVAAHRRKGSELRVYLYYGRGRCADVAQLADFDIILTTYGVVRSESTRPDPPLMGVHWFRLVLDEAHTIKSSVDFACNAVCELAANRRLCMTGTPIQNELGDIYSLIKFLRIKPFSKKEEWVEWILAPTKSDPDLGYGRLVEMLNCVTLRRMKGLLGTDGQPIVMLPPKSDSTRYLVFTDFEREIYDRVKGDELALSDGVQPTGTHWFTKILHLRMLCCHFALAPSQDDHFTMQMASDIIELSEGKNELYCSHCCADLAVLFDPLDNESGDGSYESRQQPFVTRCGHLYCVQCLSPAVFSEWPSVDRTTSGQCVECSASLTAADVLAFDALSASLSGSARDDEETPGFGKTSTKIQSLLDDLLVSSRENPDSDNFIKSYRALNYVPVKSVVLCVPLLLAFYNPLHARPCSSQWTTMLDRIGAVLDANKIRFRRLDGTMSMKQRRVALQVFEKDPGCEVFLVSLRAGSLGLNLVAAQRAYLMDPHWNPAVEAQAVDRVYRMGQTQPVQIIRLVIEDSIEERLQEVKEGKIALEEMTFGQLLTGK